jgi:hypothetical protein
LRLPEVPATLRIVLVDRRQFTAPELGAHYERLDARLDGLLIVRARSRRIAMDFRLVNHALPPPSTFATFKATRSTLTILLRGYGRFEEGGRTTYLRPGDVVVSSVSRRGTEAYAGARCSFLCIEWEPGVFGTQFRQQFETAKLSHRELGLTTQALNSLDGVALEQATAAVLDLLFRASCVCVIRRRHESRELRR